MRFSPLILLVFTAQPIHAQTPEKPITLYPGLGPAKHPITTSNPEAQKYFDQGLSLTWGFNRYEGLRSFRKAAELDPQAPMPYWGIAFALAPYINMDGDPSFDIKASCEALTKGLALKNINPTERAYLEAANTRCPVFADPARYIKAAQDLAARYPDDLDAQVLYADALMVPVRWHWYNSNGAPAQGVTEAEHTLEAVLRRYPNHPGANHLYIHAVESSPNPERAVPSAQRLMGIVPAEGHMVHMPGHIWLAIGDWDNAVSVNERAVEADKAYLKQTNVTGSYYPYYLHNIQFILFARSMQGRLAATRAAEKQLAEAAAPITKVMPEMVSMPEMAPMIDAAITMTEVRMARWDDILAAAKPKAGDPVTQALWRFSRTVALAAKNRLPEARTERTAFEALRKTLDRKMPWGENNAGDILDLASVVLEARTQSTPAAAVPFWKRAVAMQDALVYDEPPDWYYPVRESLGAALLLAKDAAGAEAVFHEGLRKSPNNGRMIFGLLQSLKAQNKSAAVAEVQREFDRAWQGADVQLKLGDL
jgi:tetratricopeptide (TPR) repeat protein